jgi:predicted ATPase
MIRSIEVTSGFAASLPALQGRNIEFQPGLNVLFGPNGCGKSSVLRIMAAYSMIPNDTGGWSRLIKPHDLRETILDERPLELPKAFGRIAPGKCEANVHWNGRPSFIYDTARIDQRGIGYFFDNEEQSGDGLTDMTEQMGLLTSHLSQGELNSHKFMRMWKRLADWRAAETALHDLPKFTRECDKSALERQIAYLESLECTGPCTLLLDEPDRSYSIESQIIFWMVISRNLASSMQVIVATHNPLVLMGPVEANIVDMVGNGYADMARSLLSDFTGGTLDEDKLKAAIGGMDPTIKSKRRAKGEEQKSKSSKIRKGLT